MNEVINDNKYKLKYWFAMLYINGSKFMISSVFTYQRLSKDFILYYFIKIWVPIFVHPILVADLKNTLYSPLDVTYQKNLVQDQLLEWDEVLDLVMVILIVFLLMFLFFKEIFIVHYHIT